MKHFLALFILINFLSSLALGASPSRMEDAIIKNQLSVGKGTAAAANLALDVVSTTKAFAPPRMTTTQRDAVSSPTAGMVVYNTTTLKLNQYNGTAWVEVGSGGQGGVNWITNYDLETDATGWSAYLDAAGTSPVDATGGSPGSFTCTRVADTNLKGLGVLRLTHPASNTQGSGCSYDFTVDKGYRTRTVEISFLYRVNSGTFTAGSDSATGDLVVYAYDKGDVSGTTRVIQPNGYKTTCSSTSQCNFVGTFQLDAQDTQYRLALHWAGTGSSAATVDFDEISIGPKNTAQGPPISEWSTYTPTVTYSSGAATNVTTSGKYRRVGDTLQAQVSMVFSGASAAFSGPVFSLPSGLSFDTAKFSATASRDQIIGYAQISDSGNTNYSGIAARYVSATTFDCFSAMSVATHTGSVPVAGLVFSSTYPFTLGANDSTTCFIEAPISGWGANVSMSNDGDSRNTGALYQGTASGTLNSSVNLVTFPIKKTDTHAAYSSGTYTVPSSGYYDISATAEVNGTFAAGGGAAIFIRVNGSEISRGKALQPTALTSYVLPTAMVKMYPLTAGDLVTVYANTDGTTPSYGATGGGFAITKVQGRDAVAKADKVLATYTTSAGQSIAYNSNVKVNFGTKVIDTFGAVSNASSNFIFTVPRPGFYRVTAAVTYNGVPSTAGSFGNAIANINGTQYTLAEQPYNATGTFGHGYYGSSPSVYCAAGEQIYVTTRHQANTSLATSLLGTASYNFVTIESME